MSTTNVRLRDPRAAYRLVCAAAVLVTFGAGGRAAHADGINTNNALTPARGQFIYRTQLRVTRMAAANPDVDLTRYVIPSVLAYGLHERLGIIMMIPAVARLGYLPNGVARATVRDYGVGDGKLLAKARLLARDSRGKTTRVALLVGAELPSFDQPFSGETFDPFAGVSFSYKTLDRSVDADVTYTRNLSDAVDDCVTYNVAYTQTLVQGQSLDESLWQLNAVVEANGVSTTGGYNMVSLSPGLQLALPELILEASYLAPVVRDAGPGIVPTSTLAIGVRRLW